MSAGRYTTRTVAGREQVVNGHGDVIFSVDVGSGVEGARLAERAGYLNDVKRKYTAAARLWARIEALPGFAGAVPEEEGR